MSTDLIELKDTQSGSTKELRAIRVCGSPLKRTGSKTRAQLLLIVRDYGADGFACDSQHVHLTMEQAIELRDQITWAFSHITAR